MNQLTELKLSIARKNNLPAGIDIGITEVLIACGTQIMVALGATFGRPKTLLFMTVKDDVRSAYWDLEKKTIDEQSREVKELLNNILNK